MDDLISRKKAIELLDKRFHSIPMDQTTEILFLRKDLSEMPSKQLEIVRCRDCKWWNRVADGSKIGYCHAIKHGYHSKNWEIDIYRKYEEKFYCADGERRTEEEEDG